MLENGNLARVVNLKEYGEISNGDVVVVDLVRKDDAVVIKKNDVHILKLENLELVKERFNVPMFKKGDVVIYKGAIDEIYGAVGVVQETIGTALCSISFKNDITERLCLNVALKLVKRGDKTNNDLKIGDKVIYTGKLHRSLYGKIGIVVEGGILLNTVCFPDAEDEEVTCDYNGLKYKLSDIGKFKEKKYIILDTTTLNKIGDGNMRKILVIGNTGNYQTQAKKGDIVDVLYECFGYVMTSRGKVKDIDYIEYREGEMIAHINDLKDCFKAGVRFTDENNLVYPDGKIALKAENLQYLDRTFKLKRINDNQIVIGNEKVELCFGKSEIGTIVEFRR